MTDLMVKLPAHYQNSPQMRELQRVIGLMGNDVEAARDELFAQLSPKTAYGWGLELWERAYGISVDLSKPLEYRRTRVVAKQRGRGATTVAMIQNVAESFTNGQVAIEEHNDESYFVVRFTSNYGVPPNIEDLRDAINEIKPGHLDWLFEYLYRTWGQLTPYTWGALAAHTWDELKGGTLDEGNGTLQAEEAGEE